MPPIKRSRSFSKLHERARLRSGTRSSSSINFKETLGFPTHLTYERCGVHSGAPRQIKWIRTFSSCPQWNAVENRLKEMKKKLATSEIPAAFPGNLVRELALDYCETATRSNFRLLDDPEILPVIRMTLPLIVDMALELPALHVGPIPGLCIGDCATIRVSRKLCSSLLSNAILSTFPIANRLTGTGEEYPSINFDEFFDTQNSHLHNYSMKKEKLKCFLNYIQCRAGYNDDDLEVVTFIRKGNLEKKLWKESNAQLCEMEVDAEGTIDDALNFLQVDFANRVIGGGVLRHGCVQEEIKFSLAPELIVARLFTEPLGDNEAMELDGFKSFSRATGYSYSFRFVEPNPRENQRGDRMCAIDALRFFRHNKAMQYTKQSIDRELNKSFAGFSSPAELEGIATGNWGCGAFLGDPELKFLLQWMSATEANWPTVKYFTFQNVEQRDDFQSMVKLLKRKKVTVGRLYGLLDEIRGGTGTVFQKIKETL